VWQATGRSKSFRFADWVLLAYRIASSFVVGTWPNWMKSKGHPLKNEGSASKGEPSARRCSECLSFQVNPIERSFYERLLETVAAYDTIFRLAKRLLPTSAFSMRTGIECCSNRVRSPMSDLRGDLRRQAQCAEVLLPMLFVIARISMTGLRQSEGSMLS
jgi:hypothetical protein